MQCSISAAEAKSYHLIFTLEWTQAHSETRALLTVFSTSVENCSSFCSSFISLYMFSICCEREILDSQQWCSTTDLFKLFWIIFPSRWQVFHFDWIWKVSNKLAKALYFTTIYWQHIMLWSGMNNNKINSRGQTKYYVCFKQNWMKAQWMFGKEGLQ